MRPSVWSATSKSIQNMPFEESATKRGLWPLIIPVTLLRSSCPFIKSLMNLFFPSLQSQLYLCTIIQIRETLDKMTIPKTDEESRYPFLFSRDHDEDDDIEDNASDTTKISSLESFGKSFHTSRDRSASPRSSTLKTKDQRLNVYLMWVRWTFIVGCRA